MAELDSFTARVVEQHTAQVADGMHDDSCEWRIESSMCHCSKRRREAAGRTTLPKLEWQHPLCTGCGDDTYHDGNSYRCDTCCVAWDSDEDAHWTDDYGDLSGSARPAADQPRRRSR